MIKINLITSDNAAFSKALTSQGFTVFPFESLRGNEHRLREAPYTLLDLDMERPAASLLAAAAAETLVICLSGDMDDDTAGLLKMCGIPDCLPPFSPSLCADYVRAISEAVTETRETFTVLDSSPEHVRIIEGIAGRFGYPVHHSSTIEDFYGHINGSQPAMMFINIGSKEIDFNRFIREARSSLAIKKSPVVAYKDMREGLFVHELINGLGKITKLILSTDELYCMLADMLFKREMMTCTSLFNHAADFTRYASYAGMTPGQIYYEIQPDPCGREPLLCNGKTGLMKSSAERIERVLMLGGGIEWLTGSTAKKPTCGAGA